MKQIFTISLITVFLLGVGVPRAHAGDEAVAAIGGFLAGVITGTVINDSRDYGRSRVHVSVGRDRYKDYGYGRRSHRHDYGRDYGYKGSWRGRDSHYGGKKVRSGHWEIRRVRVWVPGYWETSRKHCGEVVKVWKRGHYKWEREKVWVSYRDRRGGICYLD